MELPEITKIVTQRNINLYAEASRDFNPVHINEEFARKTSLGGTIAHGMLILAYVSEMMTIAFGERWLTGGKLDAQTALTLRLVHGVAEDEAGLAATLSAVLDDIIACAPGAVAATKRLIAQARLAPPESLIDEAAAAFSLAAQGSEGIEGTTAFLQKRKPSWAP